MDKVIIERAGLGDAPAILDLQKVAYQSEAEIYGDYAIPPLTQTLTQLEEDFESNVFLKARQKGRIIGSVRGRLDGGTCHIGRLIVDPAFQNQGIGTRLLREIEQSFPEAERYELFTGERSERNLYLYQREGYSPYRSEAISEATRLVFLEKHASSAQAERPTAARDARE
jgi:ribosomal protein S18 acetylase RimI-like enzyme